jgi:hypothetical protein
MDDARQRHHRRHLALAGMSASALENGQFHDCLSAIPTVRISPSLSNVLNLGTARKILPACPDCDDVHPSRARSAAE